MRTTGWKKAALLLLMAALLTTAAMMPAAGCGGDDDSKTSTSGAGATDDVDGGGADATEMKSYVEEVRELVGVGDQLNAAYRELVDRYNSGSLPVDEVISKAEQNASAYSDMSGQLSTLEPPEGLGEAHDKLLSGFDKWRRSFELDAEGLEARDNALLDEARALDEEAVAEVNDAIEEINRLTD